MNNLYKITDFNENGFLHTRIYDVIYKLEQKLFSINVGFADLKTGGALVDCTITITDWWDFEVLHYKYEIIIDKLTGNNIPELDSIVSYSYDNNILILEDLCGIEEYYQFVFTKPKIHITGQYDPD